MFRIKRGPLHIGWGVYRVTPMGRFKLTYWTTCGDKARKFANEMMALEKMEADKRRALRYASNSVARVKMLIL